MKFVSIVEQPFHEISYRSSGKNGEVRHLKLPFYRAYVDHLPDEISALVITSDLQGRELDSSSNRLLGEVVAEELNILCELGELPTISLIALAGDLFDYPDLRGLGGTGDVTDVWNSFANLFRAVVGVLGNHDELDIHMLASNAHVLDGSSIVHAGLRVGGVSGIIGDNGRNQRKPKEQFLSSLRKVISSKNDLILMHQGPEDPVNKPDQEPVITKHIESRRECVVAFGHRHWESPFLEIGNSHALNVDKRVFVITQVA